jgi:hypothetical protein
MGGGLNSTRWMGKTEVKMKTGATVLVQEDHSNTMGA